MQQKELQGKSSMLRGIVITDGSTYRVKVMMTRKNQEAFRHYLKALDVAYRIML